MNYSKFLNKVLNPLFRSLLYPLPCLVVFAAAGQNIAFPGAEGGGKYTTGGRGGKTIWVENLNDKGEGSLRKAVETEGARTILFRVSGNIELSKPVYIKKGDITIAGQSAPGDGICLVNYGIRVETDNVIIRFIRVRPGDKMAEEQDAITGTRHKNIIIDHCSMSWTTDETASFYDNTNFTMQWCILSESLYNSVHHKGPHGFGAIWGGNNATFHHNLFSDHTSRNPRFCGSRFAGIPENEKTDFRNNVIYNWGYNSAYGGEEGYYNIIGNFFKPGPATRTNVKNRILDLTQMFYDPKMQPDTMGSGWFFIDGNEIDRNADILKNNWGLGVQGKGVDSQAKEKSKLTQPVGHERIATFTARQAYKQVLQSAGASLCRDAVDTRIIGEVKSGKEKFGKTFEGGRNGIIDSPSDVGGWPKLKSKPAPKDSDNDGMPDDWETRNNLNPLDNSDGNNYSLNLNYTNLEVYLNSLVAHLFQL